MDKSNKTLAAIHIGAWIIVFISPLTFLRHGDQLDSWRLVPMLSSPIFMMIVFYSEYLYITPNYFFKDDRRRFWIYSLLLVVVAGIGLHVWLSLSQILFHPDLNHSKIEFRHGKPDKYMNVFFIIRNTFNLTISATLATMSLLSLKWQSSEIARKDAEVAKADAELSNLKNQINPHFLLNTLNNIYALTTFNKEKAQKSILQLSALLRHMLYDNQQQYVKLSEEVDFIDSYINLMRIRTTKSTSIIYEVDIPDNNNFVIAPLIFISLIENAFKHGISNTENSFINIRIATTEESIECIIENSNFPKSQNDRSGHGIGLQQVARRLELSYPGKYKWEKGVMSNGLVYFSHITIYDTQPSE